MDIASEVANKLLQIKAIKLSPQNPFTWASGLRSPIYCDNRVTLSYPEVRQFLVDCFVEKAKEMGSFELVAGVATAGIPHGVLIADRLGLPFIYVRSQPKGHGRRNQIEGRFQGTENTLVIEDLISTGGSSLQAVEVLREGGCQVAGVLSIFSYGLPQATEAFEQANCAFSSLSDYETLIKIAAEKQVITPDQQNKLQAWRKDPLAWSNNVG